MEIHLTNKVVKMTINGVAYDKITDNKGYVYSNVNLNPGTYQANVVFNGDNYYSSSSISNIGCKRVDNHYF